MGHPADRAAHAEGEGTLTQTSGGHFDHLLGGKTDCAHVLLTAGAGVEPVPRDTDLVAEAVRSGRSPEG